MYTEAGLRNLHVAIPHSGRSTGDSLKPDASNRPNLSNHSNPPNPPNPPNLLANVRAAFAPGGVLVRAVEGYEPREGQRAMAEAVAAVLEAGGTLLVEAGTGTGKTIAYLIPAILSRNRVLVSTGTKNLQEQIFFKDLPALRQSLGIPFTATLMKGRSNYLCLHRFEMYRDGVEGGTAVPRHSSARPLRPGSGHAAPRLIETGDRVLLPVIDAWAKQTETGDRAELRDLPEDLPVWKDIAADAETCLGAECPRHADCFVTRMRQRAAESDVVIVNHHLLCADAAVRQSAYGEVIPSCGTLVVDEAHQLEDVATQYFGVAVSNYRLDDLVHDGERLVTAAGRTLSARQAQDIHKALTRISDRARAFFSGLSMAPSASALATTETRVRYTAESIAERVEDGMRLAGALEGFEATLALIFRPKPEATGKGPAAGEVVDVNDDAEALIRRASELRDELRFLMRAGDENFVYYLELRGRGVFLRASPIDVSRIIQTALFENFRTAVLTSATLAVEGSFEYVRTRLGVAGATELRVPSEFDYHTQAILYLPRRMPAPRAANFGEAAAREVLEILKRTEGRAFVLFTSYSVLRTVQQVVEMSLPYPVLVQGKAPRSILIEEFRRTPHAVLLATSSFWQGVDVVGDALSCVIIDKLPFASPSDPVTAARIDAIGVRGGDPFGEYQVPLAILTLQQGLGRLIRHRSDRGVLAVLDPRLRTMGYGRRFLASLPPAPVTTDIRDVERFFL
jgi:ATP-dependent DNA helicase DinG